MARLSRVSRLRLSASETFRKTPLLIFFIALCSLTTNAFAGTTFAYPPPGSLTFTASPACAANDTCGSPAIASPGGVTWTFSNVQLADWSETWWGPQKDQTFEYNSTPFTYSTTVTNSLSSSTLFYASSTNSPGYIQRFRMIYNSAPAVGSCPVSDTLNMVATSAAGITDDNTIGYVAQIVSGQCLQVQMFFEVCANTLQCPLTDTGSEWQPAINAFAYWSTINHPFNTNFAGGFYYNDSAPTVSAIPDQTVSTVGVPPQSVPVGPINFTISDDGNPNDVVLSNASSTNASVVNQASITLSHVNGMGSISFIAIGQPALSTAMTTLSFTATDGLGAQTITSFNVTVNGDTPPVISNVSQTNLVIQENSTSIPITFTVADNETPAANLTLAGSSDTQSVISNANIGFTGPDPAGNGSMTLTSTNIPGTANVMVIVSDGQLSDGTTVSVRVNAPPSLQQNSQLNVSQGGSGTITSTLLNGVDPDTSSPVIYVVNGQPHAGTLFLNGVAGPSSFTQTDVNNGVVTYMADGSCSVGDNFQFELEDVDGGFANDPSQGPGPTTYSFGINVALTETAPTPSPLSLQVALGGSQSGTMSATSTDCGPPTITYAVATNPQHGQISNFNSATGGFTYTANQGYQGSDSFTFTASTYGTMVSSPATVSITIQAVAPVANAGTLTTHENDAATGTLSASDADQPPPTLTYAIATQPSKGTVTITNATTGAYTYSPNHNAIGPDSFTFTAAGFLASNPATISVQIRPYLKTGDILVTDQGNPTSVVFIDPTTGNQATFSADAQYNTLQGIAVESDGHVLVSDTHNHSIFRIDPDTGTPTLLTNSAAGNPANLAVEANGDILIVDFAGADIVRIDPMSGAIVGSPISLGSNTLPTNVAVAASGVLWATDAGGTFAGKGGPNNLWTVNADGSNATVFSSAGYLNLPLGLALGAQGDAYVSTFGPFAGPGEPSNIIHIDSAGNQTLLTSNNLIDGAAGLARAANGNLYATSEGSGAVVEVDPTSGAQTSLSTGGLLSAPFSIAIAPALPGVDLTVSVTSTSTYLPGGKTAQFIVTVQNNGNQSAVGATVADVLPANLSAEHWTCVAAGGASCTASGTVSLHDTITVPLGGTLTYTVTATVAKLPESTTTYSVTVTPAVNVNDIDETNNTSKMSLPVKLFANGFEGP